MGSQSKQWSANNETEQPNRNWWWSLQGLQIRFIYSETWNFYGVEDSSHSLVNIVILSRSLLARTDSAHSCTFFFCAPVPAPSISRWLSNANLPLLIFINCLSWKYSHISHTVRFCIDRVRKTAWGFMSEPTEQITKMESILHFKVLGESLGRREVCDKAHSEECGVGGF